MPSSIPSVIPSFRVIVAPLERRSPISSNTLFKEPVALSVRNAFSKDKPPAPAERAARDIAVTPAFCAKFKAYTSASASGIPDCNATANASSYVPDAVPP